MNKGSGVNTKFCLECKLKFSLHMQYRTHTIHCPICLSSSDIRTYKRSIHRRRPLNMPIRQAWTTGEEQRLVKLIDKGFIYREIASTLARTPESVRKKAHRMGYRYNQKTNEYERR